MDLQDDDRIITVHGGGQFLIEREVPEEFPPNTVFLFSGRDPFVKGLDGKWRDAQGSHRPAVNDGNILDWVEAGFTKDRILFNPNDTKEA